jgi:hypothetical protein
MVGIGTTSPTYPLEVNGNLALDGGGSFYNQAVGTTNGFRIDEATTNLITNPSVETNSTNWGTPFNAANTGARDTAIAKFGTASFKANRTGAYSDSRMARYYDGVSYGTGTYTASAWIYIRDSAIGTVQLQIEAATATLTTASNYTTTNGVIGNWVRITQTFTITSAGTFFINAMGGANQVGSIFIDGLQMEQKPYATTYADGSLGQGYAWTGAANASTSTRQTGSFIADGIITAVNGINVSSNSASFFGGNVGIRISYPLFTNG